jgi:hypothetical protein
MVPKSTRPLSLSEILQADGRIVPVTVKSADSAAAAVVDTTASIIAAIAAFCANFMIYSHLMASSSSGRLIRATESAPTHRKNREKASVARS